MKRRPRVQVKPVIPSKEGASKPGTDVAPDSEFTSAYRSLAVSASALASSSTNEVDGLVITEERDVVEIASTTDTVNIGVLTQGSVLESVRFHGDDAAQEKNKEDGVFGNVITAVRLNSEYVSAAEQNLNGVSGFNADLVSASNVAASQVPCSVTVPEKGMSAECLQTDQHLDAVKEASIPCEESDYKQLIEECKDSAEAEVESSGPPLKRRRFIKKQPNVVKNMPSCASVGVSTSASSIESPAEVESAVPQPMVELLSFAALRGVDPGDSSVAMDAADNCKAPNESTKSADGPEISHDDMDTVDLYKCPSPVPMSPPILSPKVRHHFTKVRPNLANCLTSKHSTSSDRLPKVNASTVDDGPFIPPPIAAAHSAMRGLEQGIANEESVVVLPETVEKAAAKLIARKLKKKKKRALENLDAPIDSSKVCMRDLIYMNPVNNPMRSKSGESVGNDSVKSSAAMKRPMTSTPAHSPSPIIEKVAAPQLKIGPDGSIIINEASLVIERQPVPRFEDTEAIDETDVRCGYPKRSRTRSWNKKETRRFFAALSMIGTDFFLMMNLFPGRTRAELKRKFKREEKVHQAMVETALSDRRSLDMSLMAVHSSDEEEVKPKVRQPGRRGPRANKKQPVEDGVDKSKVLGGKENDPQPPIAPAVKEKKQKLEQEKKQKLEKEKKQKQEKQQKLEEKQTGKRKKKKSRYYEESSDEGEQETEEQLESGSGDAESTAEEEEDDQRSVAEVPSQHMSDDEEDEDDVEIVSCFSSRPTRSGRVPKPVRTYNAANFSNLDDSALDSVPATRNQPPAKRKPESFKLQPTTAPSPARSAGLMSPPPAPFMSPNRVPCSSPHGLRSPLSFYGGSPGHAPMLSPLVSCSPSSQMSLLASSIPGLENVPPGKQLMIVASPVMAGDTGEPPQQLLHVFMVSSPEPSDSCNDGQDPMPMESTPNGNYPPVDSGLVAHSSNSRTREHCTSDDGGGIRSATSQFENCDSSVSGNVRTASSQKHFNPSQAPSDSRTFSPTTVFKTPIPNHSKSVSFGTDTSSRVSLLGSKFDDTLASTLFHGVRQHDSTSFDRTHGTNGSVSPILSNSALEYCVSQVANVAPASLETAAVDDDDSIDEDDIELEGNITDVLQQDDEMASADPGSDMISQATESAEDRLEKDSGGKGGGVTEEVPLNGGGVEEKDPEAVDVKFENGIDENGNEEMDEFIEVFIETIPDLDPTLLDSVTLSGIDAAIMSCATDDECKTATAEEKHSEKVELEKELMPAEKCISRQYAESVAEKCISDNLESVNTLDISVSSEPNRYLECGASDLPSIADVSTPVSFSLEPVNSAAKVTTDTDVSSGPLQNNNNDADRNRFLNVVPLPDGSVEIVLDSAAWSSADPDQERYLDLEFPFVDEQAWIGCDILEF